MARRTFEDMAMGKVSTLLLHLTSPALLEDLKPDYDLSADEFADYLIALQDAAIKAIEEAVTGDIVEQAKKDARHEHCVQIDVQTGFKNVGHSTHWITNSERMFNGVNAAQFRRTTAYEKAYRAELLKMHKECMEWNEKMAEEITVNIPF